MIPNDCSHQDNKTNHTKMVADLKQYCEIFKFLRKMETRDTILGHVMDWLQWLTILRDIWDAENEN